MRTAILIPPEAARRAHHNSKWALSPVTAASVSAACALAMAAITAWRATSSARSCGWTSVFSICGSVLKQALGLEVVIGACHRRASCACSHSATSAVRRSHPSVCPCWLRAGMLVGPLVGDGLFARRASPTRTGPVKLWPPGQADAVVEREPGRAVDPARRRVQAKQRHDHRPARAFLGHALDGTLHLGVRRDLEPARDRDHRGRKRLRRCAGYSSLTAALRR
jgi:hypothetical protein